MKISSTTEPLRPDRIIPAGDARTAARQDVAETERVQLSDLAARLSQLETQFGASDFDAKKVDEVRQAIAEGRFKVDSGAIADKLLASVAELLGKK